MRRFKDVNISAPRGERPAWAAARGGELTSGKLNVAHDVARRSHSLRTPGPELVALAEAFPNRSVVGVDVAEGMVRRARAAVHDAGLQRRVVVRVGDAMEEPPSEEKHRGDQTGKVSPVAGASSGFSSRPAAIVCCFALNQLPDPPAALERWARSLAPGGVVAVAYWPGAVEDGGPWRRLTDLTLGVRVQDRAMRNLLAWLPNVTGLTLCRDSMSAHAMTWPGGAAQFWEVLTRQGAWHARRLAKGDEDMERVHAEFLQAYPEPQKPLEHWPKARILVLESKQDRSRL